MSEADRYTLDTSAIIAYFVDEPGAMEVERLLAEAAARRLEIYASFMTYMEVLYRLTQLLGAAQGKAAYLRLKGLPVRRVDVSESLLLAAARIKVGYPLSVADAWIAATAISTGSRLVHKDPEFRPLATEVEMLELPFKGRKRPPR